MKQSKQVINVTGLFSIRSDTHRANVSGSGWGVLGSVCRVVSCRGCLPYADVLELLWSVSTCCFLVLCSVAAVTQTLPSGWLTSWSQSRELELTGCRVPATPRSDQIWTVKVTSVSPCCTILHPCTHIYQNYNSLTHSYSLYLCLTVARLWKYSLYFCQMRYTHPGCNQLRVMLN